MPRSTDVLTRVSGVSPAQGTQPRSVSGWLVESVGQDVTEFKPGDEVYGTSDAFFAEYVVTQAGLFARKPVHPFFEQAAAIPVSGVTELPGVRDRADVQRGEKVLIIGASGGVGTFAIQMAKGLRCRSHRPVQLGRDGPGRNLGADHVVDYPRDDFADDE
jgi:NADPH:quinone reductase-like Zn-dependent oxidoreductase